MPTLEQIIEALLLASEKPVTVDWLVAVLAGAVNPDRAQTVAPEIADTGNLADTDRQSVRKAITAIQARYQGGVLALSEVASGFRFQIKSEFGPWIALLQEERPQKYSRALLETLAIIAYRQPVTRGDIEDIRGVAVSSHIMKSLQEREWVRVVGHKDVPGKPGLYATTRQFLDYFNLRSLEQLPPLADVRNLADIARTLEYGQELGIPEANSEMPVNIEVD